MKIIRILAFGLFVPAPLCLAQTAEQLERADELLAEFQESNDIPGLAFSVGKEGLIVFSEGYGFADLEHRVPVYPSITKFRVGSVAKPMTSVAIGLLVESGQLDLDAPVQQYVASFPVKEEGVITTRLLGGHLAGIRHYNSQEENFILDHYEDVVDALKIFADDPLVNAPGEAYSYSSFGYNLLSAVVQSASGRDFLEYMDAEVFTPLNMNDTMADQVFDLIPNRAEVYVRGPDGLPLNAPPADNSYKWAGGGFLSTSEDLVRFGFGMLHSDVLEDETKELLWTRQQTSDGTPTAYGIGWNVSGPADGDRYVMHSGGSVGGSTYFRINRDEEVVMALIVNYSGMPNPGPLITELQAIFEGEE
jgi:CubicO group peptidase (beta-lactamase class C family)